MPEVDGVLRTIGKYRLLRELGRGGMGVVYYAQDTLLGRMVALKTLYPSLVQDPIFIARFKEEARSIAHLSHPNIVKINSFEEIDGVHVIDMEYIDGLPLGDLFQGEVVTPAWMIDRTRGVIEALAMCHQEGLVHRDVKPGNILVDAAGRSVLTDFGLATAFATHMRTAVQRTSSTGFFLGTPRYAPPEAWENGAASPAWDVYSLGVIMYEFLSGKVAFDGGNPLEIMRQMVTEEPPPLVEVAPVVSDALGDLVDEMLDRDPAVRPPDAGAVLARLKEVPEWQSAVGKGTSTMTVSTPRRRRRPAKKRRQAAAEIRERRVAWAAMAVMALTLAAFAGYFVTTNQAVETPPPPPPPPGVQSERFAREWITASALPTLRRGDLPTDGFILEGVSLDATASFAPRVTCWVVPPRDGAPGRVTAWTRDTLWRLAVTEVADNDWALEGHAARYTMGSGLGFRQSTVRGRGRNVSESTLAVSLDFVDVAERTRLRWEGTFQPHSILRTDTAALLDLESTPGVGSLLYRELHPRGQAWAREISAVLPAVEGARALVPWLPAPSGAEIDGHLHDPVWARAYFTPMGRAGELAGRPAAARAKLRAVAGTDGLLLAVEGLAPDADEVLLRIAMSPAETPRPDQRSTFVLDLREGRPVEGRQLVAGRERPWTCAWPAALRREGSRVTAEILVPADAWPASNQPSPGHAWRINVQWGTEDAGGAFEPWAAWGHPETTAIQHGAILEFTQDVESQAVEVQPS